MSADPDWFEDDPEPPVDPDDAVDDDPGPFDDPPHLPRIGPTCDIQAVVRGVERAVAVPFDDADLEGVRRAVSAGYPSTSTVARLLATIEARR